MKNLSGKSVLVTGGSRGIGLAIAERFVQEGSTVTIVDLGGDGGLASQRIGCHYAQGDVSDEHSVAGAIAACISSAGRLDVLVNNAGIEQRPVEIQDMALEDWQRVLQVDLTGVFLTTKYAVKQMRAQGTGGAIVNIASIGGLVGMPNYAAYVSAKAGVVNLTRACAWEQGPHGIRVNAVAPTAVLTEMLERVIAESPDPITMRRQFETGNALAGLPSPQDVAAAVAFLASDDARFITGVILPVDAGHTAH